MKNYLAAGFFALVFAGAGFLASVAGLKSTVAADVQNVKIVNSRTPFLAKVDLDVGKGTASNFTTQDIQQIFQVPDGKQLVIEHASAEVKDLSPRPWRRLDQENLPKQLSPDAVPSQDHLQSS